ncbi:MAG: hypothetical protein QM784_28185 [Polyangiaceae bacterium]
MKERPLSPVNDDTQLSRPQREARLQGAVDDAPERRLRPLKETSPNRQSNWTGELDAIFTAVAFAKGIHQRFDAASHDRRFDFACDARDSERGTNGLVTGGASCEELTA